ncbi:hypothetical protein N7510_000244 [Penicillium lagena]|uniref:uncharacterized protein n=1 Tax=Penicillium lagena TaxID=94218 RepID=UPI00254086DC|nr:uncharacterized protein N7510_000244 [Penicillium lagena]KAJ5623935.1 hypothetical protein N7510_000244 [Penicillium lagena]
MAAISFGGNNHGLQIGDNRGSIKAEFYLPQETPPSPLSTVPFTRDPDFVRRNTLLDRIHEKSSVLGSRIALVGLGGVGKSQLAIEYSYQVRSKSPATWVFWVHASNEARFEQSFRDIADQVKISGRQDPQVNIFKLVENWLRDEKIGKWVCILDNVDDDKFLCSLPTAGRGDLTTGLTSASTKPLLEYVPRSRNGSIIITSRAKEVALKLVDHKGLIEVKPMEQSEALELLQRKLEQPGESQERRQLVNALEFMPLAIVQAASYIRNRAPRYSVSEYLGDFQRNDHEAIRLLKKEAGHLYRDWEAKNSILVTWQISFDYMRHTKPSAAKLLSLMSFFDRQGIPESLIRHQPKANCTSSSEPLNDSSGGEPSSESDVGPDFEDDIMTLRDYSFISISENSSFFTMHRLVQLTTHAWLKLHGQIVHWREKFINNLFEEFPTGQYENWERCRTLFPHVKAAMSQRPSSCECLQRWATLLHRGAWYASECGNITDVREMASKSREQRIKILGGEHQEALYSTAMLAKGYWLEGRWEEAEQLDVQVLETRKTKLGEDHLDTLTSMASLASTYWNQGRWKEAEQLFVQVLETRKTKLGEDHPETLTIMANLASTYQSQGRWEEAEQLEVEVLETRKTKLGKDYPETLTSIANLASTYRNQGRWGEAEQLEVEVLETRKTKLGKDHPNTLSSMANLASTYSKQGRWEEAKQLDVEVLKTRKTKLGQDHPDTLSSMANLASTYWKQGRWEEAEQLDVEVLETRKTKLGEGHPDTLSSMANLASTYWKQGRWEEAEQLDVEVLETRKTKLGEGHPDTLSSMANLASTYRNQGRWEEAEQLFVQVLESRKTKLGEDHPNTLTSMANLASTYRYQGRCEEAEQLDVEVLETRKTKLGEGHPDTLSSMANLASTYQNQGRWEEAEQLQVHLMEMSKTKLGVDHLDTLTSMANLNFT